MDSLSPAPRPRGADTIVIGAGVVGASIAQRLSRQGVRVLVLDGAPGIGGGCSYANAALIAPQHVTPLATPGLLREAPRQMIRRPPAVRVRPDLSLVPWLSGLMASAAPRRVRAVQGRLRRLAVESTGLHRALAADGLSPTLRKTGALDVHLRAPRSRGELLTPEELRALEPTLAPVAAGSHDTEEWTLESRGFVRSMLDDAGAHGAEVRFGTVIERLLTERGRVVGVRTSTETVHAEHVVLAAGLGSVPLAASVGLRLPLRGGRGYVIDLAAGDRSPSMPVRIKDHRVVVTPLVDRIRVCGSIEFGREGRPVDHRRSEALRAVATRALPGLRERQVIDRWAGDRPCAPDGVPVIGASGVVDRVSVATGHGMWGMILAPVTARIVAESIVGEGRAARHGWLSPDRFGRRPGPATLGDGFADGHGSAPGDVSSNA